MRLKSFILTIGLSLFALSGLLAQEKYEYGTLKNYSNFILLTTATGQESFKISPKENDSKFLEKLNELNEKGWEVYFVSPSISAGASSIETYYLRKKKNQ